MRVERIIEVLLDWNFWERTPDTGIERKAYVEMVLPFLSTNQAIGITGVRRCGKSTIMMQTAKSLISSGTSPKEILIVNCDDYRFYGADLGGLGDIYETYLRKIAEGKRRTLFLDEVQKIPGWEKFARTLLDKKEAKIVVSGSNTKLVSEEYASLLTGRHVKLLVFPLNFREFLHFKGMAPETELEILADKIRIKKLLDEYFEFGGFPEVVLADERVRKKMLADCLESIITKDVVERHNIKEKAKLVRLARYYLSSISSKISFNRIKESLDMPLRTVERFSSHLEEAYLIFLLKRFSYKVREQEKANRKAYSVDTGLSNAIGFRFSEDSGRIMENVVFLELMKKNANNPGFEIYYWQDASGKEVDFVTKEGINIKQAIQVCWDISNPETRKRETNSLLAAMDGLKLGEGLVITEDFEGEETLKGKKIRYVPLWKWLLGA